MSYQLEQQVAFLTRKFNHICACVKKCLGIDCVNGDPNLYLNQRGLWSTPSGGGGSLIPMTYADFLNALNTSSLIPLSEVLITDFKTVHYIPNTNTFGSEDIHVGNVEPMIVRILDTGLPDKFITSTVFFNAFDTIEWIPFVPFDHFWDAVAGQSTGIIIYRKDINGNTRDYDFRNVVFRRWESSSGSGIYDALTDTGFAYQDFSPFPNGSYNQYIKSPGFQYASFDSYYLDNTVFQDYVINTTAEVMSSTTFLSYCNDSKFGTCRGSLFRQSLDFVNNTYLDSCLFTSTVLFLNSNFLANTQFLGAIESVTSNFINSCTFTTDVRESLILNCTATTSAGIIRSTIHNATTNTVTGSISDSIINDLSNNNISGNINRCSFGSFTNNTLNSVDTCSVGLFDSNSGAYSISLVTGAEFQNNEFGGNIQKVDFNTIVDCSISATVQNHKFLSNLTSKTFTPTANMQNPTLPTISKFDQTLGDVEESLNAGTLTYTAF